MPAPNQKTNPPVPDTGKVKTDLEALAGGAVALLQQPWAAVMPSIIDAAERDKDLARLQSQIHAQTRAAFVTAIERPQERRELPRSQDPRHLIPSILDPILYRL